MSELCLILTVVKNDLTVAGIKEYSVLVSKITVKYITGTFHFYA